MSHSQLFTLLSVLFCFTSFGSSSSLNTTPKCSPQQTLAMLLFKQNLSSIDFSFDGSPYYSICQDWLGYNYHPVMMSWNSSIDCCNWDGITCNRFTGDVIGIDLSCGMLRGTIHPNTTLFHLPHLQKLNLAYNDFTASQFPGAIGRFSNSLTHLNISQCGFTGEVSWDILLLSKLVSLDLSLNKLQIQPYVFNNLLQNSTHLRELLLANVDIDWVLPTHLNISSSLKSLGLSGTGLKGKLPDNIFNIQYLEILDLSHNNFHLTGPLPEVKVNMSINIALKWLDLSYNYNYLDLSFTSTPQVISDLIGHLKSLKYLDLSFTNIAGEIPGSIGHLKSLGYLDLSLCGLMGALPNSLANLRHLITLDLSYNDLNGTLHSFLFTLPLLENIILRYNMFSGGLPSELFNSRSLKKLSLRSNQFDGEINQGPSPPSFLQLINLIHLDLSHNNFTGLWELETVLSSLPNLQGLYLSYSGLLVVTENSSSYVNPNFMYLGLASCKLTVFPKSLRAMKNLRSLDLSDNDIKDHIPDWAGEIGVNSLYSLNLSHNSITRLPQFKWDLMIQLYLQHDSRTIPSINM